MKNIRKILICVAFVLMLSVSMVGCFKLQKTPINAESFKNSLEELDFVVSETTEDFSAYSINIAYVAVKDDYEIIYVDFISEDEAEYCYNNIYDYFSDKDFGYNSKQTTNGINYSRFEVKDDNKYNLVSYIENTMICVEVTGNEVDDIEKIVEDLGY